MAYDAERQEVVLFGGQSTTGVLNDTWVWNGTGWSQKAPTTSPSARSDHSMAYDAVRKEVVLFGGSTGGTGGTETWVWSGITWTNRTPATSPSSNQYSAMTWDAERGWVVMVGNTGSSTQYETWAWTGGTWVANALGPLPVGRYDTAIAYDAQRKEIVIFGGWNPQNGALRDTQIWSGGGWQQKANVDSYVLDMRSRASGVWNFTNITIGLGVNVDFQKNDSNTGVTWLASGPVNIDGTLNLSGNPGKFGSTQSYNRAAGGAGGYDGGMGGARFDQSGAYSGTPGQGPGGGAAGQTQGAAGSDATHKGTYGNSYLLPLIGGSGGGGGASGAAADGPNGGGGGGAILIASSRDLTLNGGILANGGNRGAIVFEGTNHYGGYGSGGSVVLVADRLNGSGTISAKGGDSSSTSNNAGRVRLEGYLRPLLGTAAGISPVAVEAPPLVQRFGGSNNSASLRITQVAGQAVPVTLTGSFDNPDVVFQQAGSVDIVVAGANLPDGTQVGCRITVGAQIITLPTTGTVALASGSATFSTTVPAGLGTIQAFTKNFTGQ